MSSATVEIHFGDRNQAVSGTGPTRQTAHPVITASTFLAGPARHHRGHIARLRATRRRVRHRAGQAELGEHRLAFLRTRSTSPLCREPATSESGTGSLEDRWKQQTKTGVPRRLRSGRLNPKWASPANRPHQSLVTILPAAIAAITSLRWRVPNRRPSSTSRPSGSRRTARHIASPHRWNAGSSRRPRAPIATPSPRSRAAKQPA